MVYNPLDKENLGASVANALLLSKEYKLNKLAEFDGAGIYVIYYHGAYEAYEPVAMANIDGNNNWPIYVGKAIPAGGRKGGLDSGVDGGTVLYRRLNEHAETIKQSKNLDIDDFSCKYLVVDDIWIPLGESLLIKKFKPVWNMIVDGFGNHDPGGGRYNQQKSFWDILHPGRSWAEKLKDNAKSTKDILKSVELFLKKNERL
jgi:hypothetical protein